MSCSSLPLPLHHSVFQGGNFAACRQTFEMSSPSQLLPDALSKKRADGRPGHNAEVLARDPREKRFGGNPQQLPLNPPPPLCVNTYTCPVLSLPSISQDVLTFHQRAGILPHARPASVFTREGQKLRKDKLKSRQQISAFPPGTI